MHEFHLEPTTALGAVTPRSETFGAVTVAERSDYGLCTVATRRSEPQETSIMGLSVPTPGTLSSDGSCTVFWSSPGQWFVMVEGRTDVSFASELKSAAPNCSVTEQTDGFVAIDLVSSGGAAPLQTLLEKLVNLDPERLAPGCATRTLLEQISVFIVRHSQTRITILAMRSEAQSLWHALTTNARFADNAKQEHPGSGPKSTIA